ncbi:MAG TPA: choice-of-anchor tandem repeat GloVer-containing protein [Bacteroidia bacterium]|nr:choice-of-anchor tandem repeat GloVer-containing protein [Bacteroidia bacterium]
MKKYSLLLFALMSLGIGAIQAQYTILHSFNDTLTGVIPISSLTQAGGKFFGMTYGGGLFNYGCIFSIDTNGVNYKDLFDFNGIDGKYPGDVINGESLTLSGNRLYGTTSSGGVNASGNIFSIDTNGSGFTDLFDFNSTNGYQPTGLLILSGNELFGTTWGGGTGGHGGGVVFSLHTDGSGFKVLYNFKGVNSGNGYSAYPYGGVILTHNTLFGMAYNGGTSNAGTIYSIDTNGNGYKDIFYFNDTNGAGPVSTLTLSGNKFYGMTGYGGVHQDGVIFSIDTNGYGYKKLFDFNRSYGDNPFGGLSLSGKMLFGMTEAGGLDNYGEIFSIDTDGSNFNRILHFTDTNGRYPLSSLTISGNVLYGLTPDGGADRYGVLFRFDTSTRDSIILAVKKISANTNSVTISPNPSKGIFRITLSHSELVSGAQTIIEIYSVLGEKVAGTTLKQVQGDNLINVSEQPNGVYLYRVVGEDGSLIGEGKIVVQK